jgi:hypothetical protein
MIRINMAIAVESAFGEFYEQINLSGDHRETANTRKDDVVARLKKDFEVLDAFATGSLPKFTALKGNADPDVMVVLHYGKHIRDKAPSQVLESVQRSLSDYRTNVRKNGQAVTLYYKTWPNVDIVPVPRVTNKDGSVNCYEVLNANNGCAPALSSSASNHFLIASTLKSWRWQRATRCPQFTECASSPPPAA